MNTTIVKEWLGDLADEYLSVVTKPPKTNHTEKHHILPSSLFPEFKKDPENIVELDILDHLLAHEVLAKTNLPEMKLAFWMMFSSYDRRYGNLSESERCELLEKYELARIEMAKVKSEQGKKYIGDKNPFYGKTHSKEFKENNSKLHKGKKLSSAHIAKLVGYHTGRPKPKIECPYCKQMVYKHVAPRTHFDKCKLKED